MKNKNIYPIIEFILAVMLIIISISVTIWKGICISKTQVDNFSLITFGILIGLMPTFIFLEIRGIKDFVNMIKQNKKTTKNKKKV